MLSALDTELLTSWAREAFPSRWWPGASPGPRRRRCGTRGPGEPVLRSLRSCQRQVEAEIKKYRERSAGAGEGPRSAARSLGRRPGTRG